MVFVGIDPGVHGGMAVVSKDGALLDVVAMPGTERDVFDWLEHTWALVPNGSPQGPRAVLEHAHSLPKQGHVGAFTFGRGYGALRMALTVAEITFDEVGPAKWQQVMGCRTGGDKNITKRRAQQLFPMTRQITHATADALVLAEFCRRLAVPVFGAKGGR